MWLHTPEVSMCVHAHWVPGKPHVALCLCNLSPVQSYGHFSRTQNGPPGRLRSKEFWAGPCSRVSHLKPAWGSSCPPTRPMGMAESGFGGLQNMVV